MKNKPYFDPELSPKDPTPKDMHKTWFVHVRYLNADTGQYVSKKFKHGVNSISNFQKRLKFIMGMQRDILEDLTKGWNPLTNEYEATSNTELTLTTGLLFALDKCDVAKSTRTNYRSTITAFLKGAAMLEMDHMRADLIEKKHIKLILEKCRKQLPWSNHGYNKHLGFLGSLFTQLVEWEVIKFNPAHKIGTLQVAETRKYIPYTEIERNRIRMYLTWPGTPTKPQPPAYEKFFTFIMIIFQTGIRPFEVLRLKINNVDLDGRVITIYPNLDERTTKTNAIRQVPINDFLAPLLQVQMAGAKPDMYLFGSPFPPTMGNRGRGCKNLKYFIPSYVKINRDTVSRLWNELIMVDLRIHKHLYASKHSGADAKILAGIDIDALKEMYGHSSKLMTEKYISVLRQVHHKQIIDKGTDF